MLEVLLMIGTLVGIPAFGIQVYDWYRGKRPDADSEADAHPDMPFTSSDSAFSMKEELSNDPVDLVVDEEFQQFNDLETLKFIASMLDEREVREFSFITSKKQITNLVDADSDVYFSKHFNASTEYFLDGEPEELVIVDMFSFDQDDEFVFLVSPLPPDDNIL